MQEIAPVGYPEGTLLRHTVRLGGATGSGDAFATADREGAFTYYSIGASVSAELTKRKSSKRPPKSGSAANRLLPR